MPETGSALHLLVHGRVQGVAYRASAAQEARRLNLDGWVRNRADGTVEAVVAGSAAALAAFVEWAHRGPPHARVSRVDAAPSLDTPPPGVAILPDAP